MSEPVQAPSPETPPATPRAQERPGSSIAVVARIAVVVFALAVIARWFVNWAIGLATLSTIAGAVTLQLTKGFTTSVFAVGLWGAVVLVVAATVAAGRAIMKSWLARGSATRPGWLARHPLVIFV